MTANSARAAQGRLPLTYPFDWQEFDTFDYPLDEQGIPKFYEGKKLGWRYNHVNTVQYGLHFLHRYALHAEEASLRHVKNITRWLIENFRDWRNGIGGWIYDYSLDFYGPQAPWISALSQAQGISLLLRASQIFPDPRIEEIAQRAYRAFLFPVKEGGVVSCFPDGSPVFEEYPTDPPSQVLNGHIYVLIAIYDFAKFWDDAAAFDLFYRAVLGLKNNLHRYDTGFWNYYDLHPTKRLTAPMYVKVHIRLLHILAELSGDAFFRTVAARWQTYLNNPVCKLRWLVGKSFEKIRLRTW